MRLHGATLQIGLAGVGLAAAYVTWQRPPDAGSQTVIVVDATKNDVRGVRYEDDKTWVELARADDGVTVRLSARDKSPERTVRGSEAAEKLLDGFAPLRATRDLGKPDDKKKKELGLDTAKRRVVVHVAGGDRAFRVATPTGSFNPYFQDERTGEVYLLGSGVVSDLEAAASRMIDRQLHRFKAADWDGITVAAAGKTKKYVVVPGASPTQTKLAPESSPDKPDETAKNWLDKLNRAWPVEVLGKGEQPKAGTPVPSLRIDYTMHGKPVGFVELARLQPPAPAPTQSGAPAPVAPPVEIYARSEHTMGWVKLAMSADDVLKESPKIAGAQ